MANYDDDVEWYYLDSTGKEFGPFPQGTMRDWYSQDFFPIMEELIVKLEDWGEHHPLRTVYGDISHIFSGPPPPEPGTADPRDVFPQAGPGLPSGYHSVGSSGYNSPSGRGGHDEHQGLGRRSAQRGQQQFMHHQPQHPQQHQQRAPQDHHPPYGGNQGYHGGQHLHGKPPPQRGYPDQYQHPQHMEPPPPPYPQQGCHGYPQQPYSPQHGHSHMQRQHGHPQQHFQQDARSHPMLGAEVPDERHMMMHGKGYGKGGPPGGRQDLGYPQFESGGWDDEKRNRKKQPKGRGSADESWRAGEKGERKNNGHKTSQQTEDKRYTGKIKSYNATQGFGFIECEEIFNAHGRDVFLHKAQIGKFKIGATVCFSLDSNKRKMPQARDLSYVAPAGPNARGITLRATDGYQSYAREKFWNEYQEDNPQVGERPVEGASCVRPSPVEDRACASSGRPSPVEDGTDYWQGRCTGGGQCGQGGPSGTSASAGARGVTALVNRPLVSDSIEESLPSKAETDDNVLAAP